MPNLRVLLVLAIAALAASRAAAAGPLAKPNVVIILTDDQGRGDYGAFGTPDIRTPNIDRVFREGMTFDNFFANSCVCSPTRAALLSGCYPDRVGVPGVIRDERPDNSWGFLSPSAVLLPKLLKPAGYHTAIVGKWHLGIAAPNTPTDRGFDRFDGFLGDMMDDYYTHRRNGLNLMRRGGQPVEDPRHATDLFTDWACEYLRDRAAPANRATPFLLYLAYNAPHDPVQPPPEWLAKVQQREPNMPPKRQKLVALIEHLDAGIGRVLAALDEAGLARDTVVVFCSDNGGILENGANNGPWRSGKQHMYEGGLRVPCAVRWPAAVAAGSRTGRIGLSMDLFPTVLEAAGAAVPPNIDGVSLLPTLRGESPATRPAPGSAPATGPAAERSYYFVRREGGRAYGGKTIEALRRGDWKVVQDSPFAPIELFNLKDDPKETTDLSGKAPRIYNELRAELMKHVQRGGATPWQPAER
ncbi:MAG TPA: sulfatase-like hydrolase/transferase [Humisphaera sp.]